MKNPVRRALALVVVFVSLPLFGFTQSGFGTFIGNGVPMGHEWITRRAAMEVLLGHDPIMPPDPNDPRLVWTKGLAKNLDVSGPGAQAEIARILSQPKKDARYESRYQPVYDSIMGERWVDIGGFNVTNSKVPGNVDCWDNAAQEPAEVQYDHFMRRFDDSEHTGGSRSRDDGGIHAATESQKRFVQYFVDAAMAAPAQILMWDGGGSSAPEQVDRNYFLMGRAAHLFEDSFSSEHTVRHNKDNHERVRQVKSYLCALGSEQHSHATSAVLDYTSGDVIWLPGTSSAMRLVDYRPSLMKTTALVAMEATKDLWAAFIRTMGTPMSERRAKAESEANALVKNWLSFDPVEMQAWYDDPNHRGPTYVLGDMQSGKGQTQSACMIALGVKSGSQLEKVNEIVKYQRQCLFNTMANDGYSDVFDPQLHLFYYWKWKNDLIWYSVPSGWTPPNLRADSGKRAQFSSVSRKKFMKAPLTPDAPITATGSQVDGLHLIMVGPLNDAYMRATFNPSLFFSYTAAEGLVKLWKGTNQSTFKIAPRGNAFTIMNTYWSRYVWADESGNLYLTSAGKPENANAQWMLLSVDF